MNSFEIAVCDDEEYTLCKVAEAVNKEFSKSGINVDITKFSNPKHLIDANRIKNYTAIFLDIGMDVIDGIEAAKIIKQLNPKTMIIFVTSIDDMIVDSYDVHPFYFISKSRFFDQISNIVADMKKEMFYRKYVMKLYIDGDLYKLFDEEIVYIESYGNYIIIKTIDGVNYKCKDSISKRETELSKHGFVRTHNKYLVNLKYICQINKKENTVSVIQGYSIPVSRNRMKLLHKNFLEYYGGKYSMGG